MGNSLSKADLLAMNDRKPVAIQVGAWAGVTVYVRPMSGRDRDELEAWQRKNPDGVGMRAQIVARCLCDDQGRPYDWDDEDVDQLAELNGAAIEQIVAEAARLSVLTPDALEDAAKNSPAAPSGDSG